MSKKNIQGNAGDPANFGANNQQYGQTPQYGGPNPQFQPNVMPQKPRKPWYKKWWVWLLALILLVVIGGALSGGDDQPAPQPQDTAASEAGAPASKPADSTKKQRLTLDDGWEVDRSGYYVTIRGYVSNNSDKAITNLATITFDVLDANGANLDTCIDTTSSIDPNGKWKFKATCLLDKDEVSEIRFKEVSGF